jgi:hypothetical protein
MVYVLDYPRLLPGLPFVYSLDYPPSTSFTTLCILPHSLPDQAPFVYCSNQLGGRPFYYTHITDLVPYTLLPLLVIYCLDYSRYTCRHTALHLFLDYSHTAPCYWRRSLCTCWLSLRYYTIITHYVEWFYWLEYWKTGWDWYLNRTIMNRLYVVRSSCPEKRLQLQPVSVVVAPD